MTRSSVTKSILSISIALLLLMALPHILIRSLIVSTVVNDADIIIVLGGGGGSRLKKGVLLYGKLNAKQMLLVDRKINDWKNVFNNNKATIDLTNVNFKILDNSWTTYQDAITTLTYIESNSKLGKSPKNIIVVTDPYHTRRAQLVFKNRFSRHPATINIISSDYFHLVLSPDEQWWQHSKTREVIFKEVLKIVYRSVSIIFNEITGVFGKRN